jgi:hypothetical protein
MNTNVCTHANLTGTACGDACNPGSTCQNGNCALSAPLQCPPDPDLCHPYRCDPVAGCVETAIAACCLTNADCTAADPCTFCDTGNVCKPVSGCHACSTNFDCDPCGGTMCDASRTCVAVTPLDCTNRYPNFYGACVLDANGTPSCQYQCLTNQACDDGNACNGAETCSGGTCLPGTAPECDDHEFCTDDGCDATAGCTHSQKTGFPSVRCHLDDADAALQAAGSADVSSAIRAKLGALFGKVRTSLGTAESTGHGKPALKQLKLTGKRLKAVGKAVHAAQKKKNKIASGLANTLLATVDGASQAVEALKPLITP